MSNEEKSDKENFIPRNELFLKINGDMKKITNFNLLQTQVSTLLNEKKISEKQFKDITCTVGMDFMDPFRDNFRGKTIKDIKEQLDSDEVDNNIDIFVNISNKETDILCLPKDQAIQTIGNIHVPGFLTHKGPHKGPEYSKEYADKKDYYLNNPERQIKFGKIPILGIWTQLENILSSLKESNIHILLKVENMTWNDVSPPYIGAHHTVKGGDDLYIVIPYKSEYTSKSLKRIYTSNISRKKIQNKRIEGIDFTGINLDNTVFENCKIDDCTFNCLNKTMFIDTEINGTTFNIVRYDCTIQNCSIKKCKLIFNNNCTIIDSKFINCEMSHTQQHESIIKNCHFEKMRFLECLMFTIDLTTNIFKECTFSKGGFIGCNLSKLDLSNNEFIDYDFQESNMKNINVSKSKFYRCDLSSTDLTDADLSYTYFEQGLNCGTIQDTVNLDGANLTGANLTGSNLKTKLYL